MVRPSSVKSTPDPTKPASNWRTSQHFGIQSIAARGPCHGAASGGHGERCRLARIELRGDSVEARGVECVSLGGIDAALICGDLQSVERGWRVVAAVPAFAAADDAPGPGGPGS